MDTAPAIVFRFVCYPCFYRIIVYISDNSQQIFFIFYAFTFVSSLEQVAGPKIFLVITQGITGADTFHNLMDFFTFLMNEQVYMIAHQAIAI